MIVLLIILLLAGGASAQYLDPQSASRAGVHDLGAKGVGVLGWNPAVLAPLGGFRMSFELPAAAGAVGNNAYSVKYWNDHLAGDRFFDDTAKESILGRIPDEGLRANLLATAPILGFSYNRFGVRVGVESASQVVLPEEMVRLALYGDELYKRYDLDKFEADHQTVVDYGAGFGYHFEQDKVPGLFFGLSFHFYQGLFMSRTEKTEGDLYVTDSLITGSAVIHGVTADRGDGVGFDLGAMANLNDRWTVGLSLRQIGARITWNVDENSVISFYTDSLGVIPDSLQNDNYVERAFHYKDTTTSGGAVETGLPPIIQANARYLAASRLTLLGDLNWRLSSTVQGKAGIEVGAAGQYEALDWLLLQGGATIGGPLRSRFGLGAGLRFTHYELDIGATWNGGLLNSAHGVGFGISHRLKF